MKELMLEKQKLEQLKADVNNMEYEALQRRFRRVNATNLIPKVRMCLDLHTQLEIYNCNQVRRCPVADKSENHEL